MDDLFSDAVQQLLSAQCTPQVVRAIEAGGAHAALWQQLEDAGFADALVPESAGGAGLGLADVQGVLMQCGAHALPLPLGETLLARGLLAAAGVARPAGAITLAEASAASSAGGGALRCANVHLGAVADWVLVARLDPSGQGACRLLPTVSAERQPAGFCLDATLQWPANAWDTATPVPGLHNLRTLQAALYAAQIAGALMAVFTRTLQYANERQQFGKPIGKFQAIQHQLAVISEHCFAARMAAQLGLRARGVQPERLRAAVAKARTSEAALEVAALAHSIHGAIGFTAEFDLQLYTRRLHNWRQAAGSESYWHDVVGQALLGRNDALSLDLLRAVTDVA
ncbi:acyl-CoA dehydrogenase family protein [Extensimonas vulgaris]|uniref:Acyl-CoA dehydrogenase n=1 Tax=Extensimonas vulgaris TaxID=1031594 RepID=A0A369AHI6_9BURK|nr:acyl-CoA dehydrogenase family protein [Extensimonas vulgaris]RCX08555.1 acyl-CoA dehydrogenase [Extensimonas vulgaris]TWI39855.1 acyl-CoA dehydrogenase [Extensimonas vulgaris]TXD14045.1 acyl-CoA dehydrogenase [Extensimonas vulgaris]